MYYKLVRNVNGRLTSVNANFDSSHNYCVTYIPGQKTLPRVEGTKLYLFADIKDARDFNRVFYYDADPVEIWECEAENAEPTKFIGPACYVNDFWRIYKSEFEIIQSSWGNELYSNIFSESISLQEVSGTYWCDSITLTKKNFG